MNQNLSYPRPNEYIATDFSLCDCTDGDNFDDNTPQLVAETKWTRLWFKQDKEFKLPKGIVTVHIKRLLIILFY